MEKTMEYIIIILWTLGAMNVVAIVANEANDWHADAELLDFLFVFFWPPVIFAGVIYGLFTLAVDTAKNNNPYL